MPVTAETVVSMLKSSHPNIENSTWFSLFCFIGADMTSRSTKLTKAQRRKKIALYGKAARTFRDKRLRQDTRNARIIRILTEIKTTEK